MIWHLFLRFEPKGKTYWDKATFTYCVWNIHCQGKSKVLWAWHNTFFWVVFSTLCGSFRSMLQIFITCQKFPEWNFQCSLCKPFILYEFIHQSNMLVALVGTSIGLQYKYIITVIWFVFIFIVFYLILRLFLLAIVEMFHILDALFWIYDER